MLYNEKAEAITGYLSGDRCRGEYRMWNLKKFESNTAMVEDSGRTMTYRELAEESARIGAHLKKRSLAFLFCENRIDSVAGYVACLEHNVVPVLLKHDLEEKLRAELFRVYRPDYIYLPKETAKVFAGMALLCEETDYLLLDTGENELPVPDPELALLLTTSGSTGSPKLVRLSYRNIAANTASIIEYLGITEDERAITTLPMNYTYGLSIINTHLMAGACLCMTDASIIRSEFWEFFEKVQATSFGGVPYTYEILHKLRFTARKQPSLRYMTQAGGKLSPELHKIFAEYARENGKQFIVMYGQTEATARMGYLPGGKALEKCGSMGIAIPGGTLWLRDTEGNRIETPGEVGELIYEGENVTPGYAQHREDLSKGDERGGILETGDMAYFDEDGYFFIVGRLKRFLKLFGNRVNLDEAEGMLREAFPDVELACGGQDDLLKIYVVSEDEDLLQEIRYVLSDRTGLAASGFQSVPVSEIPRNEAGKIRYKMLEK